MNNIQKHFEKNSKLLKNSVSIAQHFLESAYQMRERVGRKVFLLRGWGDVKKHDETCNLSNSLRSPLARECDTFLSPWHESQKLNFPELSLFRWTIESGNEKRENCWDGNELSLSIKTIFTLPRERSCLLSTWCDELLKDELSVQRISFLSSE